MKKQILVAFGLCCISSPAFAHFGMVIPDTPIIDGAKRNAEITFSFSHPFEGVGMDLVAPKSVFVYLDGEEYDVQDQLTATKVMDHSAWKMQYTFQRPGVYSFVMEPTPYWEPSEDVSIIHYTKTMVPAFGDDSGWDEALGLPAEIVPVTRPFGNYAGNIFQGQVLVDGEAVPYAEVEVELYNQKGLVAPSDYHVTQVIKADNAGVFSFVCPQPGWWGFAALTDAPYTLKNPEGEDKGVEIGAVFWTYMHAYEKLNKAQND